MVTQLIGGISIAALLQLATSLPVHSQSWSQVGLGVEWGSSSSIRAMASTGDTLYLYGTFDVVGGTGSPDFASWDGSTLRTYSPPTVYGYTMTVHNGVIHIGTYDGSIRAWVNGDWQPVGASLGATPWDLLSFNGELYAAGNIFMVRHWDGTNWVSMSNGLEDLHSVLALHVHDGELIATGSVLVGTGLPLVYRWAGTQWEPLGSLTADALQGSQAMQSMGDTLYVGKNILPNNKLWLWNGSDWIDEMTIGSDILDLCIHQGQLIVASSCCVQAVHPATMSTVNSWLFTGPGGSILRDVVVHDGDLYAGGTFTFVDGSTILDLARYTGPINSITEASAGDGSRGVVLRVTDTLGREVPWSTTSQLLHFHHQDGSVERRFVPGW